MKATAGITEENVKKRLTGLRQMVWYIKLKLGGRIIQAGEAKRIVERLLTVTPN